MRQNLVESYIDKLRSSFGSARPPIEEAKLRVLYDARNYVGMILHIQSILNLGMKVRLGLVNDGGPDAPAWVSRPANIPFYGTSEFQQFRVTIYLRKSFLRKGNFDEVVVAIAHELSHVLLDAVDHSLQKEEEAVDLTAMLFGFRDFYVTGCRSTHIEGDICETRVMGYLTYEEVGHAAIYMTFR